MTSITEYLQHGSATSREIQTATGLNQSAVSRQLRALGSSVISFKRGRTYHYILTSNAFGADDRLPLYMLDAQGNNVIVAYIRPLAYGGFFVEPCAGMPSVLLGEKGEGLYADLPYFLDDLRPQGFLGRQIAGKMAEISSEFPADPRYWNTNHVGRYLISNGDDLPGNFKFGQQTYLRVRRSHEEVTPEDYPSLADEVMRGKVPGSSAGGEQPKFTAYNAVQGHVIVKFSPSAKSAVAKRWRDILLTEFHAAEAICAFDFPAAETHLFDLEGRLFLESQRFDRRGEFGRLPLISLQAVDNEFTGVGSNWPSVMNALGRRKLVHSQDIFRAEFLWCFGRLINNTDMHLGNLSLAFDGDMFSILPVYDMCSMGFAPQGGEVQPYAFSLPDIGNDNIQVLPPESLDTVKDMAYDFWSRLAADARISDELREFLSCSNPADNQH